MVILCPVHCPHFANDPLSAVSPATTETYYGAFLRKLILAKHPLEAQSNPTHGPSHRFTADRKDSSHSERAETEATVLQAIAVDTP